MLGPGRWADRSELKQLVERRPTDMLHVNYHGQLTVNVDPEGADIRLNAVTTKLNTDHIHLQELLSTAQLDELSFFRVQFETFSCHP